MPAREEQRSIRSDATFYGHIVGLSLERGDLPYSAEFPGKMYARFEHSGQSSTYLVPDLELFTLLARHFCDNARMRMETGNYEYAKLWIKKTKEGWSVYVP